ncbi:MAG: hypothetical protein K9K64_14905 [Desulfohalobiaceae bacterium]|nr:hypothetical protein [Desulfohalobiaceae bacterium]MCF8106770.1 hypothetical protein [Desulfohalobiaceae bacterium]
MTKSLLGLHIGSTDIRIANLSLARSHPRVDGSLRLGLNGDDSIQDTAGRVLEMIEQRGFKERQARLGLDSQKALIQKLKFPFADVQKIKGVLPFELENHLPVNLNDYVWDFALSFRAGEPGTEVFALLYPKQEVEEWVRQLEAGGLSIQGVELDLTVLNTLAERFLVKNLDNFLLLDLEWKRTNLVWRRGKTLLALRYLPVGLRDIGGELFTEKDQADLEQIQQVLSGLSPEEVQSLVQGAGAKSMMQQIKLSCMQAGHSDSPAGLFLTGTGSALEPLEPILETITGLEVRTWRSLEGEHPDKPGKEEIFQIPLALGIKRERGAKRFDLLPGIKGDKETKTIQWKQVRFLVFSLGFILLSFTASFSLDIYLKQQKLEDIRQRVEQTFSSMAPDAGSGVRPMQYAGIIRSRIQGLGSGPSAGIEPQVKATKVLSAISNGLPEGLQLQVNLFSLDGLGLRFSGASPDFKTVDEIKNRLSSLDMFQDVEIVGANVDKGGQQVSFSMRLNLAEPAGG